MDSVFGFDSLARFQRCPYAYRLDQTEAYRGCSPDEFLESVVRRTAVGLGRRRLNGHMADKETALSLLWDTWDRQLELTPPSCSSELSGLLKIGEKCISNYIRFASRFGNDELVACDLRGELAVPGGTVSITIDEVSSRGGTMILTRFVTEPGIRTKADFENDYAMFLARKWAAQNLPGAERCMVQWRLLHPFMELESEVPEMKIEHALRETGRTVSTIKACNCFSQREGDHCSFCQYRSGCPRFTHESSGDMQGRELVSSFADFQEKIDALKQRIELLETQRDEVGRRLIDYADSHGYTALTDGTYKATVSHLKKAELPKDKQEVIRRLKDTGKLEEMSTVNYSRLRADITKGIADPVITRMAEILDVDRVNLRRLR